MPQRLRLKILFPMAEGGSGRIRSQLSPDQVTALPIYRTEPRSSVDIPDTDFVFLTSPSNTEVYLKIILEGKIAIGTTTRDFLSQKGIEDVLVPEEPNSDSVLRLIRRL